MGFEYLIKLKFAVIPSRNRRDSARHPFFLDDLKLRFKELMLVVGYKEGHPLFANSEP